LTSEHFVGRRAELEELEQALDAAARREPAVVLLGGDSGVGKTRLLAELELRLSDRGVLVLRGESVEQDDGELPYAPLTSALRPLVRNDDPALGELGSGSRAQLSVLLPGLDTGGDADARHDPSAQLRLFESLVELLDLLSERQPVALILEDMHWADRSTRTFVAFLARSLRQERLLLVLSYRTDELHRRHPLRPMLSELERLDHVRRIDLAPFSRTELTEVLADILGTNPDEAMVERLYARSEGNPLYTEELLAAGLDGRGAAPQSLRDAFMLRIERLPADAQRAARAIAVGRRLDEETIEEVTGIGHELLQEALREAVSEQVLVGDGDGRLMFRHALLREALYDDLLPGERCDLHVALARILEPRMAEGASGEAELAAAIAGHYLAAGEQPAAMRASVQAALAARAVHAYGEAAELAERALELWPHVPGAQRSIPLDHVDLLRLAASAHSMAGDRGRAEVLLQSALEEVEPERDPERYAAILARLSRVQWSLNRGLEGVETAKRALSLLPAGESGERAGLVGWLARTQFLRGRFRDAIADAEWALVASRQAGDQHAEGEVLNTLGMAKLSLGEVEEGIDCLRRAIELARATGEIQDLASAYSNLADMMGTAGRTREALEVALEGDALIPRRAARMYDWMTLTVAQASFDAGEWAITKEHLGPPALAIDRMSIFRMLVEAEFALAEGSHELAGRRLEDAEPLVEASAEPQWIGWFGALQGELLRRRRDLPAARAAVDHALGRVELCTDDVAQIARASAVGARVEADAAQRARDLRERAEERHALARLRIHASRLVAAAQEGGPVEKAWEATGKAELARARGRNDPRLWRRAAERWDAISRPYYVALVGFREAEAAVESGDRPAAAGPASAALETARRLGAGWLTEELEGLIHRARLQLDGDRDGVLDATSAVERDGADDPFGLTPRERQVLALLAEGATNRQIGNALFMAEKTASVHVSRILSKLGVQSRTQAAAVAHRLHLT
jgi:DNA-binding CsgD family transcriptional regulator/tetratricopeptide (TPR) repeat protein